MRKYILLAAWTIIVAVVAQFRINEAGHVYNIQEAYTQEIALCDATVDMLHQYWQYLDVELTEEGDTIAQGNFFDDVISETDAFDRANVIREGNWEGFFEKW